MSTEDSDDTEEESADNKAADKSDSVHVVHVDGVKEEFEEDVVTARDIMQVVENDIDGNDRLEATRGASGSVVAKFEPDDEVDLTEKHRTHFEVDIKPGKYI